MNEFEVNITKVVNQYTIDRITAIGIPPGGTNGQVLIKDGAGNYTAKWDNIATTFIGLTDTPLNYTGSGLKSVRVNAGEAALEFYTPATADSTKIQDTAGTTYIDTESTADEVDIVSPNTGTDLLAKIINGSSEQVFQVNGDGSIFNNGNAIVLYNNSSVYVGTLQPHSVATGAFNVGFGIDALMNVTSGNELVAIGKAAARDTTVATRNVSVGSNAGYKQVGGHNNLYIGRNAGFNNRESENVIIGSESAYSLRGSRNVFLGYGSGYRQVSVYDRLIVHNQILSDAATELTNSLIVGKFNASPINQFIKLNGITKIKGFTTTEIGTLTPEEGDLTFNNITKKHIGYDGTSWNNLY